MGVFAKITRKLMLFSAGAKTAAPQQTKIKTDDSGHDITHHFSRPPLTISKFFYSSISLKLENLQEWKSLCKAFLQRLKNKGVF